MRILTLQEVADMTRLPVATLRWMRHRGDGPPMFRLGRRLMATEEDVEAWVRQQRAADDARRRGVA
jgi:predicted DNA-binding transcriptional regulator AlpA